MNITVESSFLQLPLHQDNHSECSCSSTYPRRFVCFCIQCDFQNGETNKAEGHTIRQFPGRGEATTSIPGSGSIESMYYKCVNKGPHEIWFSSLRNKSVKPSLETIRYDWKQVGSNLFP